jgi:hypothetical protein
LPAVDVPSEEEFTRLYRDEAQALPRRVRITDLAQHVAEVDERFLVSLNLLPDVIKWLPTELFRFEPLLRASLDVIGSRTDRKLRAGAKLPFDAMIRILEAVKVSPVPLVDFARQASIHGLPSVALAPFARNEPALRAFWSALVRSQNLPLEKRVDAWRALDTMVWPEKEEELGELAEEILVRADDSEMNAFLVDPFRRRWPVRFATIASRLRISVPPISRIATGARDALAYALFHPAAALRSTEVERQSYDDIAGLPNVLTLARERRAQARGIAATPVAPAPAALQTQPIERADDAPTLFQA